VLGVRRERKSSGEESVEKEREGGDSGKENKERQWRVKESFERKRTC